MTIENIGRILAAREDELQEARARLSKWWLPRILVIIGASTQEDLAEKAEAKIDAQTIEAIKKEVNPVSNS